MENAFSRMEKYLRFKNERQISIDSDFSNKNIIIGRKNCFNEIENRVDFPVNLDLIESPIYKGCQDNFLIHTLFLRIVRRKLIRSRSGAISRTKATGRGEGKNESAIESHF